MTSQAESRPVDGANPTATNERKRGGSWDIYAIALADDPHARWREIRESSPVLDTGGGVFFVTRWISSTPASAIPGSVRAPASRRPSAPSRGSSPT